jgi:hypothetical protein
LPLDEFHVRGRKTVQSVADRQLLAIVAFEQPSKAIAMKTNICPRAHITLPAREIDPKTAKKIRKALGLELKT